jgi:uncharacterized membrane protein YfcA
VSGAINAVAGGGTFIAFGALTLTGFPPITANATSSVAQFPGYVTSALAYQGEIRQLWHTLPLLLIVSFLGAGLGALLLLSLENPTFRAMVPWLLIAATATFAAGPRIARRTRHEGQATGRAPAASALAALLQFATAIYGGFFGAGMGIMMLASLGLTQGDDYHRLNAVKNLLSIVIAAVAVAIFAQGGVIAWEAALVMVPAVAVGGWAGVAIARRVPQAIVRGFVVAVGLTLSVYYFVSE